MFKVTLSVDVVGVHTHTLRRAAGEMKRTDFFLFLFLLPLFSPELPSCRRIVLSLDATLAKECDLIIDISSRSFSLECLPRHYSLAGRPVNAGHGHATAGIISDECERTLIKSDSEPIGHVHKSRWSLLNSSREVRVIASNAHGFELDVMQRAEYGYALDASANPTLNSVSRD